MGASRRPLLFSWVSIILGHVNIWVLQFYENILQKLLVVYCCPVTKSREFAPVKPSGCIIMSFGYGVGDCLAVATLAWQVYKSCRDAPESFSNIQVEVLSLHAVLKEVEETLPDQQLTASRQHSLSTISQGCECVLKELQALIDKYESLSSKSKRT